MAPDLDHPELTGYPVEVSSHEKAETAIEKACSHAASLKRMAVTVLVEEDGTNNVWSCQFHPEAPNDTKERDEMGFPIFEFDPEYRVVYDAQEVPLEEVEVNDDPADKTTMIRSVPNAAPEGDHIITDYTASGEAVDRNDLLPA